MSKAITKLKTMEKKDVLTSLKALGLNLFKTEEKEESEEVVKKAETIKEVTDKKVTEEEIKRTEDLEGTNILTSDMVPMAQYKAEFLQLQNAFKIVVDYIQDQPTNDEIKEWVSGISNDYFKTLLSEVKSKTEVPRPSNNFEEVIVEKEEIEKENKQYLQEQVDKINKQYEN